MYAIKREEFVKQSADVDMHYNMFKIKHQSYVCKQFKTLVSYYIMSMNKHPRSVWKQLDNLGE